MIKDIPGSIEEGKSWIDYQLRQISTPIKTVLDIGCGYGTYYNYFNATIPNCKWTGVEIWEQYKDQYNLASMYDTLIMTDACQVNYEEQHDVTFVGDVLEHMEKDKAVDLVHRLMKRTKYLFISIPIVYYPCTEYEVNPYLRHVKPDWSNAEVVKEFGQYIKASQLGNTVGVYLLTPETKSEHKTFYFLSGLPRSGSTVLGAILNQHPEVFVTPTSPLLDQLISNQNIWHNLQTVKANPVPQQLTNITRRIINGVWDHIDKPIIIDKNRGWGKNMPASSILFERDVKVIATVRDLPSIMASWLTLLRNNPNNYLDKELIRRGIQVTDKARMTEMWENMVKDCFEGLDQLRKDAPERLLEIKYTELNENPKEILHSIEQFIGAPHHKYDLDMIINNTNDDDLSAWGLVGMHTIRNKLANTAKNAESVLGHDLFVMFKQLERQ